MCIYYTISNVCFRFCPFRFWFSHSCVQAFNAWTEFKSFGWSFMHGCTVWLTVYFEWIQRTESLFLELLFGWVTSHSLPLLPPHTLLPNDFVVIRQIKSAHLMYSTNAETSSMGNLMHYIVLTHIDLYLWRVFMRLSVRLKTADSISVCIEIEMIKNNSSPFQKRIRCSMCNLKAEW